MDLAVVAFGSDVDVDDVACRWRGGLSWFRRRTRGFGVVSLGADLGSGVIFSLLCLRFAWLQRLLLPI